jgi:glutathione S-transferase
MVKDEFDADKADGTFARSLGKVPYLEVDNVVLSQSKTIERYVANRYNMFGRNDFEMARIDALCEYVRDYKTEYQKVRALSGDERTAGMDTWFTETLPGRLAALDTLVGKEGFSVGQTTSLSDVTLFTFMTQFFDDKERSLAAMSNAPNVAGVVERGGFLPTVKEWIKLRPDTPF